MNNTKINNPILGNNLQGLDGQGYIETLIPNIAGLIFVFGGVAFFFMFIWGAVSWILSGGDKAHIENAKGRITSALVGMVLLLSSFAIVMLIENFFKINILTIDIGPLVIQ